MNKPLRLRLFALLSLLLLLLVMGAYRLYAQYQQTHFNCDAMLRVHKDNAELALVIHFTFQGNNGIAFLKGTLKQDEEITNISRKNYFNFNKKDELYHLKSISTVTSPADNSSAEEVARYLPRFYLQQGLKFDFSLYPAGWAGNIFSTGYVPSFYCSRS
ncbi:hypothetical protein GE191_26390 [Serratia fonticola]|uniref:hypothetical protein n=1 Tax=Serratia fonticola TaxID=47917 RepID=UPI001376FE49|nr:hypothetical protein [Serratia fonticola]NBJ37181.1 hypothetical protein [Serratia fonticola]